LPHVPSLGEQPALAFGIAKPWHDPAMCDAAAMPRDHGAMMDGSSVSTRPTFPSSRLPRSSTSAFGFGRLTALPFLNPRVAPRAAAEPPGG
jgi:hypothetical protein